ncbi:penicillin-binding protein 1C [Candidatus Woesebacteria bacterium RIFCSPHIGHO2_01_FULL_44_10]|nr:MAG: penicillin-binding protein 1C [Candidatus Woesebacteria bacterium RIFCSPHIGHO2_01_FULL_44_10]
MGRKFVSVLSYLGKPLYKLLTYVIIFVLFVLFLIGRITREIWVYASKESKKITIPRIKFPFKKSLLFVLVILIFFILYFLFFILRGLPSPKELVTREQSVSTKIYDRNHTLLFTIYKDQNRTPVALPEIPIHVRLATLAAEDAEFYNHPGFSIRGIMRAVVKNLKEKKLSGGSTITQQLVKNALLSPEKTLIRKIREIILSVAVELTYSKDQILEMYLNEVSYGGTTYGIEEASQIYFGKDVKNLTLGEAALLAGLPQSPTKFSPFGNDPQLAKSRQEEVLYLMRINKFITQEQEEKAGNETLEFAQNKIQILAPHFVMYVRDALEEKYGKEVVEKGGLEVITTLDLEIQKLAEEVVKQEVDKLKNLTVTNGAAVVINPKTGEVLAMVGSRDYFDTTNDGNVNVTTRLRQPGSSIKVINYAYALENGFTAATLLSDTPVSFNVPGQPIYTPRNYDSEFRGYLTLRSALAESRNIPAVKVLVTYGVDKMVEMGTKMGITTWSDPANYGLSLTLGGGEVKLIDLARVYATLANGGQRPEIVAIKEVTNYQVKTLEENGHQAKQVLDPRVAFILIDILKDNTARAPAFGTTSALVIPNHPEVAVKTGTSNNLRDNLTVGFNQDYVVAVWVGNNDNSPMARIASGITGASPIWNKIMSALLTNIQSREWETPEKLTKTAVCTLTESLPCSGCPVREEWFLEGTQPTAHCSAENVKNILENKILPEAASTSR